MSECFITEHAFTHLNGKPICTNVKADTVEIEQRWSIPNRDSDISDELNLLLITCDRNKVKREFPEFKCHFLPSAKFFVTKSPSIISVAPSLYSRK